MNLFEAGTDHRDELHRVFAFTFTRGDTKTTRFSTTVNTQHGHRRAAAQEEALFC